MGIRAFRGDPSDWPRSGWRKWLKKCTGCTNLNGVKPAKPLKLNLKEGSIDFQTENCDSPFENQLLYGK